MFRFKRRWGNQRGSSTTSILVFSSALALASGAVIQAVRDNKSARSQESVADVERRINESALQSVTQLITNGALFFNSNADCQVIEPQVNSVAGAAKYNRTGCRNITTIGAALSCGSGAANSWQFKRTCPNQGCEVVDVCVPISQKNPTTRQLETTSVKVEVKFKSYGAEASGAGEAAVVARNFAYLKAQRPRGADGKYYAALEARVNLGAVADGNRGLLGRYGAADTCFYMRPKTVEQAGNNTRGFAARSGTVGTKYSLLELEPRPDGNLADEFQREIGDLTNWSADQDYAVLEPLRTRLIQTHYMNSLRGSRPGGSELEKTSATGWSPASRDAYSSDNVVRSERFRSDEQAKSYFVGVMPELGSRQGPDFQYFLTSSKSRPQQFYTHPSMRDAGGKSVEQWKNDFAVGCGSAGGAGAGADFCTKVFVPRERHQAEFNSRCEQRQITVPGVMVGQTPKKVFVNRAVQVSCSGEWVGLVKAKMEEEKDRLGNIDNLYNPRQGGMPTETSLRDVIAALEVDDAFIAGQGNWSSNPLRVAATKPRVPPTLQITSADPRNHPLRAAYDGFPRSQPGMSIASDYAVALEGNADGVPPVPATRENPGSPGKEPTPRTFNVWVMNPVPKVNAESYTSKTCAYFVYKKAEDPRQCSYSFITRDEAGFVCRNNDGCFDESTQIRMADGSNRIITQLKKGEFVFNPVTKLPAKITKLTIGPELKHLLNVRVGERVVKVTDTHPFMTRRGWVSAKNLKKGEEVLSGEKSFLPVQGIELGEFGRTVVNLALEGPADRPELHYVLADGVVTGDLATESFGKVNRP